MDRPLTLREAQARYVHRFTAEHVPSWARQQRDDGTFYAPQYASDAEWFERSTFPGEGEISKRSPFCQSTGQTWPLGQSLDRPFTVPQGLRRSA